MADFARRAGDKVELVAIDGCGRGLRALVDIAEGEIIISEPPLYAVHPEALSAPAFMRRPDVARLFAVVEAGYDNDAYTPAAESALNAALDLHAKDGVASLGTGEASRFWALDDCFRRPAAGDAVEIAGLVSERGRPLNGLRGRVDCSDGERWAVATARGRKSVRGRNLKTAGGIFRTNAYFDGGSGYVFETLCRANHSCAPNCAKAMSDRGGRRVVDVIALRAVPRGEEITVSYLKLDAPGAARRAYLREKYNFDCRCARCVLDGG